MTATGTSHVPGHPGRGRRSTYQVCVPQLKRMTSAGPTGRQITDSSLPAQMACRSSLRSAARARSMSKHQTVLRLPESHRP